MPEILHASNRKRKSTGHVIIVKIKNMKIGETGELRRESTVEDIVGKVKETERIKR